MDGTDSPFKMRGAFLQIYDVCLRKSMDWTGPCFFCRWSGVLWSATEVGRVRGGSASEGV